MLKGRALIFKLLKLGAWVCAGFGMCDTLHCLLESISVVHHHLQQ